ncbi:hypothetical protein ACFVT5_09795 [Streptomyces sp. NPDC058001]|uniref:hypothetical protein n=1 Tax=Streptomyces sp. NPDC058001 TaxID=3346300 RepID=UPI0036EAB38B
MSPHPRRDRPRAPAVACVLATTLLLLAVTPATPATAAPPRAPEPTGSWSVAPSPGGGSRPGDQDGRAYIYAEGAPGTVLEDSVAVSNTGTRALTVRLRGADADNTDTGGFSVRDKAVDTGAWITFAERTVRIPARTRAEVPFTVTVPAGATPGDHPGAVVVSAAGRDAGVRVHLRVSGPTLSALTVENVRADGDRISYDLVNRGNTVLSPKLAVRADGVFGALLDRPARALPVELLPGRRVTLREPWDPPTFDSVDVRLTVTAAGGARDTATATARFVPWVPLTGAALLLAAAAAVVARVVRVRRRGPEGVRDTEEPPPRQPALAGSRTGSRTGTRTGTGTGTGDAL